jgi:phosphoglycerate kinase
VDLARDLLARAGDRILLPGDHVVAATFSNDAETHVVSVIPEGMMALDIGPATRERYRDALLHAKTIVWNGPMGVFELPTFAHGTLTIAQALADSTEKGAMSVVGGGDSVAAITQMKFEDRVSHVSTGGGDMLEYLEGITLPGVAALD